MSTQRSFFVPETLQTSGMDCGPAALKSLLAGLSIRVSYERLRDACSSGADGTSIDALEDLCDSLGLEAFQEIAPLADAMEAIERRAPCIVVVNGAGGAPHFVLFWRSIGKLVMIMDPARGRRWLSRDEFARDLYLHRQRFDESRFRAWFATSKWSGILARRLERLGPMPEARIAGSMEELGALDGSARLLERLVARGAVAREATGTVLQNLTRLELASPGSIVPGAHTAVARHPDGYQVVRGAVFLVVRRTAHGSPLSAADSPIAREVLGPDGPSPFHVLARQISAGGRRLIVLLALLAAMLAVLALAEMLLLRAAFNAETLLSLPQQRFAGIAVYGVLVAVMLLGESTVGAGVVRLGRALELRTRVTLLEKLPRLPDLYFRTRPLSDVTHRSQGLFQVKPLPALVVGLTKQSLDLLVTTVALGILYPRGLPLTLVALCFGLGAPYLSLRLRGQVEHRVQAHSSSLGQLYLDVLLGLIPLRTHGGQQAVRAKQDEHLVSWRRESERSVRLLSITEAVQSLGLLVALVLLLLSYLRSNDNQGALLLLAFWALRLPLEARALSAALQRVPATLASMGRLVEPLTARESPPFEEVGDENTLVVAHRRGAAIRVRDVTVRHGVSEVLSNLSLDVASGEHIAIVGSSGAGKSTFFGVLLGLLGPARGEVLVDSRPIQRYDIGRLRRETVWVDPSVQLWNRSMLENLQFGNSKGARHPIHTVIDDVDLKPLLERMPKGFASDLGESGAHVSGGEGQRVRLSRALLRRGARLFLLDEAFRGLSRPKRQEMSRRIRRRARDATLLEITHDVSDTQDFDRVLVIEDGRLIEEGRPSELLADPDSRYAALVNADLDVQRDVWGAHHWKRFVVTAGAIVTAPPTEVEDV
jgi:ABC-type bacteriocin/lantibiotic exporter with double-glycine peptidase domain